jgi:membrane-bound lytic murein transglycosylase A
MASLAVLGAFTVAGCAQPQRRAEVPAQAPPSTPVVAGKPAPCPCPSPAPTAPVDTAPGKARLDPASFDALPGWKDDDVGAAFGAFVEGCTALRSQPRWSDVCSRATTLAGADADALRTFFETGFVPHRVVGPDPEAPGLLTGYYEPLLQGSRTADARFRHPIYAAPDDLVTVDLSSVAPDTRNIRLRGRLQGRKLVPYWSRAEIEDGKARLVGRELVWVEDAVELFFLQVQGSGRVRLPDDSTVRVGYADQNGHPYRSIGRVLVDRGELPLEKASMQGIKAWGQANPSRLAALLAENPSYVFFRELPAGDGGPLGALGIPLTPGRSIAVDPTVVPLGAPVFVSTTWPNSPRALDRLVMAQDTGGAIRGAVRADFFWGFGAEAGELAGRMRQPLKMWVLLPR